MKNSGEAHLFLRELLEWHLELNFIFFETHLHFLSMQYLFNGSLQIPAYFKTLSLRLTEEIVNLRANHLPRWSCCQQLCSHCEHTAAQVGLPSCPTYKAQKSWHQRRLLVHFWGLDVLIKVRHPDKDVCPNINCWESFELERERPFIELVVPGQILQLLAQCWFDSSLSLILRRSRTGTVLFYTSTSNKRAARPKLYTKSLTRDLKLMYSRLKLVRISINL